MRSPIEARARFGLSVLVRALPPRIILRNRAVLLGENINAKPLLGVQMRVRARAMVHTHQYQHRIERYRGEGVGGHAVDLAVEVDGNNSDPGRESAHRFSKIRWIQAHRRRDVGNVPRWHMASAEFTGFPAYITTAGRCIIRVEMGVASIPGRSPRLANTEVFEDLQPGVPISRQLAVQLIRCSDDDLPALLAAGAATRDLFKPGAITYSRKVFLPLTNLCRDYCGYCTFRRDSGDSGAHTMTPDEVLAVARAGEKLGCTEALFSLGDKPELLFPEMREILRQLGYKSTLHYLEAMCELILRETTLLPHPNPGLLSAEWISRLAAVSPSMGLMLETTNASLLAPGAAHDNAPDKLPEKRLRTIEEAGKQGVPFTTGMLIGIGESPEDRVDALLAIRDLHDRYGHIQEVIVQNFRAKPAIPMAHWPEPSRGEMLRAVAVARLLLPRVNIQAPPNLSAPYYEELVDAGINDWGGISPLTPDFINPEKPWPHLEQLHQRTEAKGLALRQRLPVYPEFVADVVNKPGLLSERVRAAAAADGSAGTTRAA